MVRLEPTEVDAGTEKMTKIERMDKYLDSYAGGITSFEICRIVKQIFNVDLEVAAPLSIMDSELAKYKENLTGADI